MKRPLDARLFSESDESVSERASGVPRGCGGVVEGERRGPDGELHVETCVRRLRHRAVERARDVGEKACGERGRVDGLMIDGLIDRLIDGLIDRLMIDGLVD